MPRERERPECIPLRSLTLPAPRMFRRVSGRDVQFLAECGTMPYMDARTLDRQSSQAEDADLARRSAAGDAEAFRRLTQRYYRPVGGFVLKRVQRPDLVEDLVQETFFEAYRSIKAGRLPDHFSSWLFGIAHNCCGKWLRRKRPVLFDPSAAPG